MKMTPSKCEVRCAFKQLQQSFMKQASIKCVCIYANRAIAIGKGENFISNLLRWNILTISISFANLIAGQMLIRKLDFHTLLVSRMTSAGNGQIHGRYIIITTFLITKDFSNCSRYDDRPTKPVLAGEVKHCYLV